MALMLGIDLGSHAVKMAVFEGSFGRFQFKDFWVRAVPQDADTPPDLPRRLAALQALLDDLGDDGRRVVAAAFPAEEASLRTITLPFGDRAQVEQTVPYEVEGQVPFDLEDMLLIHRILHIEPGQSQVLVALVERDRLQAEIDGLTEHGADPKHLVIDADMIGQAADRGVQAVVDIGHTRTLVTLCQDGRVLAARAISGGGRDLTSALAKRFGLDWTDAQARKHASTLDPSPPAAIAEWDEEAESTSPGFQAPPRRRTNLADEEPTGQVEPSDHTEPRAIVPGEPRTEGQVLASALAPIIADLRSTLISFEDNGGVEIDELLLGGGTAALEGLPAYLADLLGVPVRRLHISAEADAMGPGAGLGLAHALGLRAVGASKGRELDLRTGDFAWRGDLGALRAWAGYAAVAVLCFFFVAIGMFGYRTWELRHQLADIEARITATVLETFPGEVEPDRVKDPTMAIAIMQEKTLATAARVDALGGIISRDPPVLTLLRDVSEGMPPADEARIDVSELSITETAVTMKAETDGFEAATRIETALRDVDRFSEAHKGDSKKVAESVQFSITIPLSTNDGEEG